MKTLRNIFSAALVLLTALFIQGCSDDEAATGSFINFTRDGAEVTELTFPLSPSFAMIGVTCDADWDAKTDADWLTISNHAGYGNDSIPSYVRVNVAKNTGDARTANITITSGGLTKVLAVKQAGASVDPNDPFESSYSFLENIVLGYNLGNTLDANPYDETHSWWIPEGKAPTDWEKSWGQPVTTQEIIDAIAEKGFNVVRVPVTWYPHMDADGNVNAEWMDRVETVVNYVLKADCYCILNVQHDTGAGINPDGGGWLCADMDKYPEISVKYKKLWSQIADRFKDYDDKLLFESFNEILNNKQSWTAPPAGDPAYDAIRRLDQDFVDVVRASGGKNEYRNLVVNGYSAGNSQTVLDEFAVPADKHPNHILASVHSYDPYGFCNDNGEWNIYMFDGDCEKEIDAIFERVSLRFNNLGIPYFFGEFGAIDEAKDMGERIKYAQYMAQKFSKYDTTGLWWMGLMDRKKLEWYELEIVDALFANKK